MHAWLAFLAGVLVVLGAFLIISADLGIAIYGLAVQVEIVIAIGLLVFGGIFSYLFYLGVRAQHKQVKTGKEALIGAKGVVTTPLDPNGVVRVAGEFWQATAKEGSVPAGQCVEVVELNGMFLVVKPDSAKSLTPYCIK
jgi:membrane-bound serine protease (ClpP class)